MRLDKVQSEYYQLGPISKEERSWSDQTHVQRFQRVLSAVLPFLVLYKPLSYPASLAFGAARTIASFSGLVASLQNGCSSSECAAQAMGTAIAVSALVATVFAHPLGMLITTGHDLLVELSGLAQHLRDGDYKKAMEACARILNNALYLALFFHGGLELVILSLCVQMLLGLYHGQDELRKGRYLEGACHIAMALIRAGQIAQKALPVQRTSPPLPIEKSKVPTSWEAAIKGRTYLRDDDGSNHEMLYILDNGFRLFFRWYRDPHLSIGQRISWEKNDFGITIHYNGRSTHLSGDANGTSFQGS